MILYEYPLNERIRTLLRLEDLFERLEHFIRREHPLEHHVAITTLFELLEAAGRADLKSDLLQELDRQRNALAQFRDRPGVSQTTLSAILSKIDAAYASLGALTGKTGQHLRDNEWLMSVRSRTTIAGGACEFDLPSYHAWLHRTAKMRRRDLEAWSAPFAPIRDSLSIVLQLLRESAQPAAQVAPAGAGFQQPLGGKVYQMVQVRVDPKLGAIPEISANKYLVSVRFTAQGGELRPTPFEGEVEFELSLCNL